MTKRYLTTIKLLFFVVLLIGGAWILIDNSTAPYKTCEGKIFGTYYHITYQSSQELDKNILDALNQVDNSLSTFNPNSIVSRINRNEETTTNKMFDDVFILAQKISATTNGAFDITVAPLVNIWGFGFKNSSTVTQQKIDSILPSVGYNTVSLNNSHITKTNNETMMDFSAIAKGYGCDVVANMFESKGINNYLVEIGGEIRAHGKNQKGNVWTVGITKPTEDSTQQNNQLQSTIQYPNIAMATSGNYRNFYYKDGKKYAHTINPATGYPVEHNLLSATVFAPTCAMADAFATSFMVMGLDKAKIFLTQHKEILGYLIYTDSTGHYQTWCSESLNPYFNK